MTARRFPPPKSSQRQRKGLVPRSVAGSNGVKGKARGAFILAVKAIKLSGWD